MIVDDRSKISLSKLLSKASRTVLGTLNLLKVDNVIMRSLLLTIIIMMMEMILIRVDDDLQL